MLAPTSREWGRTSDHTAFLVDVMQKYRGYVVAKATEGCYDVKELTQVQTGFVKQLVKDDVNSKDASVFQKMAPQARSAILALAKQMPPKDVSEKFLLRLEALQELDEALLAETAAEESKQKAEEALQKVKRTFVELPARSQDAPSPKGSDSVRNVSPPRGDAPGISAMSSSGPTYEQTLFQTRRALFMTENQRMEEQERMALEEQKKNEAKQQAAKTASEEREKRMKQFEGELADLSVSSGDG